MRIPFLARKAVALAASCLLWFAVAAHAQARSRAYSFENEGPDDPALLRNASAAVSLGIATFESGSRAAAGLSAAYLSPQRISLGGELDYSREVQLPPFWDGRKTPTEQRLGVNALAGVLFRRDKVYFHPRAGAGFIRKINRGRMIVYDPGATYEEVVSYGFGIPLEVSMGYASVGGIGLKLSGTVGKEPFVGFGLEFAIFP